MPGALPPLQQSPQMKAPGPTEREAALEKGRSRHSQRDGPYSPTGAIGSGIPPDLPSTVYSAFPPAPPTAIAPLSPDSFQAAHGRRRHLRAHTREISSSLESELSESVSTAPPDSSICETMAHLPVIRSAGVPLPNYKWIARNRWSRSATELWRKQNNGTEPQRCPEGSCCQEECLNRKLGTDCPPECGPNCRNQEIRYGTMAPMEVRHCGRKGYGVFATAHIPIHSCICEYRGTVLTKEAAMRATSISMRRSGSFYVLKLRNGLYIDAFEYGNEGRLLNHSCDPNCAPFEWELDGRPVVKIMALRDIEPDEEICFSYELEALGSGSIPCLCGAACCTGDMTRPPRSFKPAAK